MMREKITLLFVFTISFLIISPSISAQHILETADRFTNSLKNGTPKDNIYLVIGFTEELEEYLFSPSKATLTYMNEGGDRNEIELDKKDLYKNRKSELIEYYYNLGSSRKLEELEPFELYLSSTDGMNFSKIPVTKSDKNRLIRLYLPPGPDASNKEKTKYYSKTGNSQGNLMGANNDVVWKKRTKCSVKKRKYGKDGINGVKEMTYGMN